MTNITQVHTDRNSEHDSLCLLCGKSLYFLVDVVSWRCYKLIQVTEGYEAIAPTAVVHSTRFSADRTHGRAYASVASVVVVCLSSVTLCIVAKRCVLEQKLLLRA